MPILQTQFFLSTLHVDVVVSTGDVFLFWFGAKPSLFISDPEMVKQVLANKFGFYPKSDVPSAILALLGKGLVLVEGSEWARHRRVVNPAFTMDKLKVSLLQPFHRIDEDDASWIRMVVLDLLGSC